MITIAVLLAAAGLAAFGLGWLIREVSRADQTLAAIPYVLASDGEWLAEDVAPTLGERVVEPLYDRQLEEMFAAPAADIWEDGAEPRRRGEQR